MRIPHNSEDSEPRRPLNIPILAELAPFSKVVGWEKALRTKCANLILAHLTQTLYLGQNAYGNKSIL